MTGFRIDYGCAQKHFGVTPDVTTMGKVIGGGLPVGAYGGRRDIMEQVAPAGPMYQAGTLGGEPPGHDGGHQDARDPVAAGPVREADEAYGNDLVEGISARARPRATPSRAARSAACSASSSARGP